MFNKELRQSLRFKFLIIVSVILLVSTVVISILISVNERGMLRQSLINKGNGLASYIAILSKDPLIMKDSIELDMIVNQVIKAEEVLYAVIQDASGNLLTSQYASIDYRSPIVKEIVSVLPKDSKLKDIIATIKMQEGVIEVFTPITSDTDTIGKVTLGMSEHEINKHVVNTIIFIVVLNLVVTFIIGALLFIASKKLILDPIAELAHATNRFAKGDLTTRVEIKTTGEVLALVESFNLMMEDLGKAIVSKENELADRKRAEEEREKMLLWQQSVNLLQQSLLAPAALEEKLRLITDNVVSLFDADFCRIWLIQPGDLCEQGCVHAEVNEGPHICRYRDRCLHLLASSGRYTHTDGEIHRRVPFGCYKIGRIASDEDHKLLTNDVQNDPRVHNREWANELGLVSFAGYQLRVPGGETLGVLALFAKHPILSSEDAILDGLSSAVALVIQRDVAEESLRETLESLRKSVGTTIQVMVSAVETRDPYTAGHQTRSADLARAIATEMGLPQEKVEAIRMAGPIHDIGKLSIPAEILSKPTKLSEIEFSLIKEHSRSGYEILKDVESPWPLAEIVYQHHERMDGSGYPRNLKGEEIIMEARIMAVADVVESMASHRPYRPALGIDAALEEIEKNKGILYDNTVADACMRLFREKSYQFQ